MYLRLPCYGYSLNCHLVYFRNTRDTSVMTEKATFFGLFICNHKIEIQICSNKHETGLVCELNARECGINKDFNQIGGLIISKNIQQYQRFFAVINNRNTAIHHMEEQAENVLSSCFICFLITLFHFLSQCISVPYLESDLCQLAKELDNCKFTFT